MKTASEITPKDATETVPAKDASEATPAKDAAETPVKDAAEASTSASAEPVAFFTLLHSQDKAFIENLLSSLSVETKTQQERKQLVYDVGIASPCDLVRDDHDGPVVQAAVQLALEVASGLLPYVFSPPLTQSTNWVSCRW